MKLKLLMIHEDGGRFKLTQADYEGKTFRSYVEEGFEPLAWVKGKDVSVTPINTANEHDMLLVDMFVRIKNPAIDAGIRADLQAQCGSMGRAKV